MPLKHFLPFLAFYFAVTTGDVVRIDFEAIDLQVLPDNVRLEEVGLHGSQRNGGITDICFNLTVRVHGTGFKIMEGHSLSGYFQGIGLSYFPLWNNEIRWTVVDVEKKFQDGLADGSTFSVMANRRLALAPHVCRNLRMICVKLSSSRRYKDANPKNDHACVELLDRMRCKDVISPPPKCSVEEYPEFIRRPVDSYANINESVVFECTTKPRPAKEITWYHDGNVISQGDPNFLNVWAFDNDVLMLNPVSKHHFGLYKCRAEMDSGRILTAEAWLFEQKKACDDLITKKPANRTIRSGLPVLLNCRAEEADAVQWYKDGDLIPSDERRRILTYGQLLIRKLSKNDQGTYECRVRKGALTCSINSTVRIYDEMDEVCGLPVLNQPIPLTNAGARHGFVVGGSGVPIGSSPWQVMLWYNGEPIEDSTGVTIDRDYCGGVLVGDQWVVTAAHCISAMETKYHHVLIPSELTARLGKRSRLHTEGHEKNVSVSEIIVHPAFARATFDNDIALLKLAEHVEFSDYIRPNCLGNSTMYQPNARGLITGWGRLSSLHGQRPDILQQVQVPIQNRSVCLGSTNYVFTENMFCAGEGRPMGGDSCRGDSGGPLSLRIGKKWYLLGLISWGEGCGRTDKYGFYTKVSSYNEWIVQHLEQI